jgi:hypothetical protein
MAVSMKKAADMRLISRTVISALRTQGPEYAATIEDLLYPTGSPAVDMTGFMGTLGDYLDRVMERVSKSVSEVINEDEESEQATARVDEAVEAMRDNIIETEYLIGGTYGRKLPTVFGFDGDTPTDPDQLLVAAEQVERALRNGSLPASTRRGRPALDKDDLADTLAVDRRALEVALKANKTEDRETQQARAERDNAFDAWRFAYRGVANIATGLFFLARATEMAERVRDTGNRRRGRPEPADLEGADLEDAELKDSVDPGIEPVPVEPAIED